VESRLDVGQGQEVFLFCINSRPDLGHQGDRFLPPIVGVKNEWSHTTTLPWRTPQKQL